MRKFTFVWLTLSLGIWTLTAHANDFITTRDSQTHLLDVPVRSWKSLKDDQVVKQDYDYSCGAASLATILSSFYQHRITELEVLRDMELQDSMASFADIANVSGKYGFVARGISTNYDSLLKLKIPALVYLQIKRDDHFSVVRYADEHNVYLADPSWGNWVVSRSQFEKYWYTSLDDGTHGRLLLIIPQDQQGQATTPAFRQVQETQRLLRETPQLFRNLL